MFTLRPATSSDAAYLLDIEQRVMRDHALALWGRFNPAPYPSAFDLANTRIMLLAGEQAGLLSVETATDHLRLRKLYLEPQFQGQGHGKRLLALVQTEATAAGLPLRLSVLRPNQRALAFYLREGLRVAEETDERIFLAHPVAAPHSDTVL